MSKNNGCDDILNKISATTIINNKEFIIHFTRGIQGMVLVWGNVGASSKNEYYLELGNGDYANGWNIFVSNGVTFSILYDGVIIDTIIFYESR